MEWVEPRREEKKEQTFVPLFLLKETEEATEKGHEQQRKKATSRPALHHVSVSLLPESK